MVVCKFFLQGKCKFGDRCYNEHTQPNPRQQGGRGRGRYDHQSQKRQDFSRDSPFKQDFIQPSRFQSQSHNRQQGDFSSPFSRGSGKQQTFQNQDKFHWNKNNANRFSAFQEQRNDIQSMDNASHEQQIISTIQEDMKAWLQERMWPFSCYSYAKETKCLEGLPDIQPEELRTIFYLHGMESYQGIIQEVKAMYSMRKQELASMNDAVKSAILGNLNSSVEDNPSSCLTILKMYGPGVGFKAVAEIGRKSPAGTTSDAPLSNPTFPPSQFTDTQKLSVPSFGTSNLVSLPETVPSTPPASISTSTAAVKPSLFKSDGVAKEQSSVAVTSDSTYTDKTQLSEAEIEQFEAASFILGKIPMRPPPIEYCR
ncbi:nucleoporin NUP42-like [Clavelina lepadiformis]|uniref:nucleoporin NUP42-like n=1 Tax=Clavelina lepadiformis TaxID=159417 RepID=UPI00404187E2